VDDPDDTGILLSIGIGNGTGAILGAIVNDDDLHLFSAHQEAVDTLLHIVLGIITRDGYR
jgi:hypothetical protein